MPLSLQILQSNPHFQNYLSSFEGDRKTFHTKSGESIEIVSPGDLCDEARAGYANEMFAVYDRNAIPLSQEPTDSQRSSGFLIDNSEMGFSRDQLVSAYSGRSTGQLTFLALNQLGDVVGVRFPDLPISVFQASSAILRQKIQSTFLDEMVESSSGSVAWRLIEKKKFPVSGNDEPTVNNVFTVGGGCVHNSYRRQGVNENLLRVQHAFSRSIGAHYLVNAHDIENKASEAAMTKAGYSTEYLKDADFRAKRLNREFAIRFLYLDSKNQI